ncbi:MAG TPA: 16S rRNA methyltransferase, partial [Sutterella sp.]|nr:16S rRNA methyltransferase [Sutterella sp.]
MRKPAKSHFSRKKVSRDRAKPASRVEARAHTLARALGVILRFEKPADVLMSAFFKANPQMGQKDRSTIAEAIFFAMRHYLEISWRMKPANPVDDPLAAAELTLAMQNEAEDGLSGLSPHRAQALQKALSKDFSQAPAFYRAEMPFWLFEKISAQNARPNDFFVSQTESAPLDLRVNTLKATRGDVLDEIAKLNWEARPTPFSPTGIRLVGKPALTQTAIFKAGLFDVQDEGSQLIAQLLEAHRGEMVCDFCAGAGGKTLALGAAMKSKGRLYAFDVNQKRLESLLPRARRAGLSNVYAAPILNEHDLRVKRLKNKFDRVLVDAPCSG